MKREDDFPVRGHLCPGLYKFQKEAGGCVPRITPEGEVSGCDDYNRVIIEFCPFCGVTLLESESSEVSGAR